MLHKSQRLGRSEFTHFFKVGSRIQSPTITLIYSPLSDLKASVVVSKKVSKKAVTRNTLRRQIYAQMAQFINTQPGSGVYIVVTKPAFALLSKAAREKEIVEVLARTVKPR